MPSDTCTRTVNLPALNYLAASLDYQNSARIVFYLMHTMHMRAQAPRLTLLAHVSPRRENAFSMQFNPNELSRNWNFNVKTTPSSTDHEAKMLLFASMMARIAKL